jgi:hypothetical protein
MNGMLKLGRGPIETVLTAEQTAEIIEGADAPLLLYPVTPVERRDYMREALEWEQADGQEMPAPAEPAPQTAEGKNREAIQILARSVDRTGFLLWTVLRRGAPGMTPAARAEEQWNTDPAFWTAQAEELVRLTLPGATGLLAASMLAQKLAVACGLITLQADESPKDLAGAEATPT